MDLYVEKQCVDQLRQGVLKQFMMLFDAYFDDVFKYVARRIDDNSEVERIVRLVFLDALGQAQNTPTDVGFQIWLYSLAKPRVWELIAKNSFPEKQGLIMNDSSKGGRLNADGTINGVAGQVDENAQLAEKFKNVMKKLSLEEREILRLKFFEEVTDGDVITVLGMQEGSVGPKIYRVLKRAHFLMFGESDERQGVYFGELSAFLSRIRELENINILVAFKLSLRADVGARIDRRDSAVEVEAEPEEVPFEVVGPKEPPVQVMNKEEGAGGAEPTARGTGAVREPVGSQDPAKIFVEAVREMREEEAAERQKELDRMDKQEEMFDWFERFKGVFIFVPVLVFLFAVGYFLFNYLDFFKDGGEGEGQTITRGYPNDCDVAVFWDGEFTDGEIRSVNQGISDRICGHFDVERMLISRRDDGKVEVKVDIDQWFLQYNFVKKSEDWRIKKYFRSKELASILNG
ncbi:MAG: sigma-70 family RNA polymerase sigma factor [Patescibacteria group bacterium]